VILSLLRRMSVEDQQLAERLLRELIRSRDLALKVAQGQPTSRARKREHAGS
jgi:hypothetical protein